MRYYHQCARKDAIYQSSKYLVSEKEGDKEVIEIPGFSKTNVNSTKVYRMDYQNRENSIMPLNSTKETWSFGKNIRVGYMS